MNPDQEKLLNAHQSDVEITKATKQIHDLRAGLQASRRAHQKTLATIERLEQENKTLWRQQKQAEESTRSYQSQKGNAIRALEQGAGSADAAERQIEQCAAILDELETTTLELMEQQELVASKLVDAVKDEETARKHVEDLAASTPVTIQGLQEIIRTNTATRDLALSELDSPLRDRYAVLVERKGTAMATIRREACSACRRVVPPQQVVDLTQSRLQACRGCGRWLILDDTSN